MNKPESSVIVWNSETCPRNSRSGQMENAQETFFARKAFSELRMTAADDPNLAAT